MDSYTVIAYGLLVALIALVVLVWNKVTNPPPPPPSPILSLTINPTSVESGSGLGISGSLTQAGNPLATKIVSVIITPPSGDGYTLSPVTNASGIFTSAFTVPSAGPTGSWKVGVNYAGATPVEKTFQQIQAFKASRRTLDRRIEARWLTQ